MYFEQLCARAIIKWGEQSQKEMMVEECAELIVALKHYDRSRVATAAVIEEMVDVELALAQMKMVFEVEPEYSRIRLAKIARLERLLDDGERNGETAEAHDHTAGG